MLESLRTGATSWIAKSLLGLLVLSFAVWGIGGDYLRRIGAEQLIVIGGEPVSVNEIRLVYRNELERMRAALGTSVDAETALQFGVVDIAIQSIVQRAVLARATREIGLDVPDAVVRRTIRSNPTFSDGVGGFNRYGFEQYLRSLGLSEQGYVALTRRDLTSSFLLNSLAAGVRGAPGTMVDTLYRYREEKRIAEFVVIANGSMTGIPAPSDSALARFHQDNADRFTAPEFRRVTYLHISPADLAADIDVGDDEVKEEYQERLDEFQSAERREVSQLLFENGEAAKKALARLEAGETMAGLAAERDLGAGDIDLGSLEKTDLPDEVAEAVFALSEGGYSEPLQSPLGWHVFRVGRVIPASVRPLVEVRDSLITEIALRRATDDLYGFSARLEDELAGGAGLDEAAGSVGLRLRTTTIDAEGNGPEGLPVMDIPAGQTFVNTAFITGMGGETPVTEADDGSYFILRVDEVVPSVLRPLADIREQVAAAWRAERQSEAAAARAEALVEKAKGGGDFPALAAEAGLSLRTSNPMSRAGQGADPALSPALVAALFGLDTGELASAPTPDGDGQVVARLMLIEKADDRAPDRAARNRYSQILARGIAQDILAGYQEILQQEIGVSVNHSAVAALF